MIKMFDTLARLLRDARPYRALRNNRGEVDPPPADPPPSDPPADPPPSDPPVDQNWISGLPDEMKTAVGEELSKDPNITKYKDLPEFLKGHVNLAKKIGEKGVIIPKEDSTPEEKEAFYDALGRPKTPGEYKIDTIENLHEGISITPETETMYKNAAHKAGLSGAQANELNKWYLGVTTELLKAQDAADKGARDTAETALRAEWKDKFDANTEMVTKMIMNAGGDEAINAMGGKDGIGNNPHVLKALGKIAGLLSEDQITNMRPLQGGAAGNESQQDALTKINAMMTDPDNTWHKALMSAESPKHKEAVAEKGRLYDIAYPEGGA